MFVKILFSCMSLTRCCEPNKDTISIVTNYDLNDEKDFDALALVTWNDFLLGIIHSIVLEGKYVNEEQQDIKIDEFLIEMFMPEEYDALRNLNAFIDKNIEKLLEIIFDHYGYNNFVVPNDKDEGRYYIRLHKIYYDFIKEYKRTIIENNSLLNFYTICFYRLRIPNEDYRLSNKNILVQYYSVYQLDEKSCLDILTDKVVIDDTINYRLGFFILPVFNNGCKNKQNHINFFELLKKIEGITEFLRQVTLSNDNNIYVYAFFLREYVYAHLFIESNYDMKAQSHIYDTLEGCYWLSNGLYNYLNIKKNYFDTTIYCNPNYFELDAGNKFETSLKVTNEVKKNSNVDKSKLHLVYISNNLPIDAKYNEKYDEFINIDNTLASSFLCYTISRIALKTIEIDTNEKNINYYFNKHKKAENFEKEEEPEHDKKEEHTENHFENSLVPSQEPVKENYEEDSCDEIAHIPQIKCKIQDETINQEETEENADDECDEITCVKILNICLLFYRELTLTLNKMEIENSENVFSIYQYVWRVIKSLEKYELDKKSLINSFYDGFVNKNLIINLFNSENDKNKPNINPSNKLLSRNHVNIPDQYIKDSKFCGIIDNIDLKEKKIKMIMNDSPTSDLDCDNNLAVYIILLKYGLNAVLNSYASYHTTTNYLAYLENICIKLNLKNIVDTDINILKEDNTNIVHHNYDSISFQTVFEQESINFSSDNIKPIIFYYSYYNICDKKEDIDNCFKLSIGNQNQIPYVLNFSEEFLKKELNMKACHVFVFNIIYIQNDILEEVINTKDKSIYGLSLAEDYDNILNFIKEKKLKLPRCFIIKHDNIELTMDTKTFDGNTLSHYYKPILIQ